MICFSDAIISYVKESVLKIGGGCGISFNFPPQTLKALFGDRNMSDEKYAEACREEVARFSFGKLSFTSMRDLTVVSIDEAGVAAILSLPQTENDAFVGELIALTAVPDADANAVHALFRRYASDVFSIPGIDGEFDEALCFDVFDPFCYCFSYEPDGIHYHRLLKDDFDATYPGLLPRF